MVSGVQKLSKSLGEYGCYFFSLLNVAENMGGGEYEPIFEANYAIKKGLLGQDCFVADASGILDMLGKNGYEVVKAGPGHELPLDYALKDGEHEILRFERPAPNGGEPIAHFVVGAGDGRTVAFDPWPDSLTVRDGRLVSRRIIRKRNRS